MPPDTHSSDGRHAGGAKPVMSSVDRALSLLGRFTLESPMWGLSELARAAAMDKTTTLRCLNALERNGFVEQHPETRKYRLGFAPLHLARSPDGISWSRGAVRRS